MKIDTSSEALIALRNEFNFDFKLQYNFDYTWIAFSPNNPSILVWRQPPLGYFDREAAQKHAGFMNSMVESWEENIKGFWNKNYWKVKPEPWVIMELK